MTAPVVVKVGGSLYDLPELGARLRAWLDRFAQVPLLLVPGGGPTADVVRAFDRTHGLGEETSHWLALRTLSVNAHFLAALLGGVNARVVLGLAECEGWWSRAAVPVIDPHEFARADEGQPGCLPHCWSVTSDSLAARIAQVAGASQLVLLKAVAIPPALSWTEASNRGFVDAFFPQAAGGLCVRAINFRHGQPG